MNLKSMRKALQKFGEERFYDLALARVNAINAERQYYKNKALEKHLSENILPILALYLVLKESERRDALEFSEKVANEMYSVGRKRMEFLGRLPFFYWLIKKLTPNMMKNMFPAAGWDIEWLEVSEKRVAFNMHGCFYYDVLAEYQVPELTPVFCGLDDLIYENVSPYLHWARKGTIGRGDPYCDFRFVNPKKLEEDYE